MLHIHAPLLCEGPKEFVLLVVKKMGMKERNMEVFEFVFFFVLYV